MTTLSEIESKLIEENKKLLLKLDQQIQLNHIQSQQVIEQSQLIQQLKEQVEYLTKKLFGFSSEKTKVDKNQLSLFEDPTLEESEMIPEIAEEITYHRCKPTGRKAELTKNLPVEEVHYERHGEDCSCDHCGQEMKPMGQKVIREEVCFIPAKLYKKVHISHTYACDCHDPLFESKPIRCADVPKAPIQRSLASPSTLAWLFHQKFELSLPIYRQEKEWESYGLEVSRRTLANWIITAAHDWLAPIYHDLADELKNQEVLHADETHYQILRRPDGKPATSEARIWLVRTIKDAKHPVIYYHADLTRARSVAVKLLDKFQGYLHCDGYSAYKSIPHTSLVGCWAHCRRKFQEVSAEHGKAKIGLDYCNQIFRIERELQGLPPEERQKQRQRRVRPIIEAFYTFLESFHTVKGKLRTAVTYAFNQKKELMTFLEDGRLEASNNLAEQAIKTVVIGRKNFLFSTSVKGAEANTIAYSIIETAKANGLNVYNYLTYLFEKLPNCEFQANPELLKDFLPWAKTIQENCKGIY